MADLLQAVRSGDQQPASFAGLEKTFAAAAATGNALLVRVKDNQPRLRDALVALCAERDPVDRHETIDRGRHGRQEHRRVEVFAVADQLPPEWRGTIAC